MKTYTFHSSFAERIREFIDYKKLQGYDYSDQARTLYYFDVFARKEGYTQPRLSKKIADGYIVETAHLMPNTQYKRLSALRVFSSYLHMFDPENHVLRELPVKPSSSPRYYLYSREEITVLLRYAKKLKPHGSIRPDCFYVLIGLLYVTGLRISEALALNLGHVNTDKGILLVRKGKFSKDRYVAIEESTCRVLRDYLHKRTEYGPSGENAPFFITPAGERLNYAKVDSTFRKMIDKCRIGRDAAKKPRLHDVRHAFACNCLFKWYDEGVDVNARLPVLATAMGHVDIAATQVYLHITPTFLQQAAQRFHCTFTQNYKGQ